MAARRSALLAVKILRLVGILNDGEIQIEERIERTPDGDSFAKIAAPVLIEAAKQPTAEAGKGNVGIHLVKADLDVSPANPPAPGDIIAIVPPGQELPDPIYQSAPEPLDLRRPAGNDFSGLGVAFDLGVEIVDERREVRFQQGGHGAVRSASSSVQPTYRCSSW